MLQSARLPVIFGVNDVSGNIRKQEYLSAVNSRGDDLAYHDIGKEKYARLGREYALRAYCPSEESIERLARS